MERRRILRAMGAKLVLTPEVQGMGAAIEKAKELLKKYPDSYMPQQFENPANPEIHRRTTAVEILQATEGHLDCFVAGVGTGGTITGVGEVLKKQLKEVCIVAVEPADSPVLSGQKPGPHELQGIGAGFIPPVLNLDILDEIVQVQYSDASQTTRRLAREEGIFTGISSGAICWAALEMAAKLGKGKRIVTIICDLGERYLSHPVFSDLDT